MIGIICSLLGCIKMSEEYYSIEEDLEETMKCLKEANKEIERLNENNQAMQEEMTRTWKKLDEKENIIKVQIRYMKRYNEWIFDEV